MEIWKRGLSAILALALAVSCLPRVPLRANAEEIGQIEEVITETVETTAVETDSTEVSTEPTEVSQTEAAVTEETSAETAPETILETTAGTEHSEIAAYEPETLNDSESDFTYTVSSETVTITGYTGEDTDLVIPSKLGGYPVTTIAEKAFANSGLTEVVIPDTVTTVGGYAFQRCTALKNVTLPKNLTTISTYMFDGCGALESLTLPEGLTTIESYAFAYSGLTSLTLPEGLTTIRERILNKNTGVTELVIPSTVTVMSDTWENGALEGSGITKLTFAQKCTAIPDCAAKGMASLTEVIIPDTVTSIGKKAFMESTALESIELPASVTTVGGYAFQKCAALKNVTLPENLTTISTYMFDGCGALKSLTLPEGLTTIESYAFAYSGLTSLTLPEGLTTIRERILNKNTGVTELVIPSTVTVMSDTWENGALEGSGITKLTFAQKCTAIPDCAAKGMASLTEVTIPDTVTSIGKKAFMESTALESIVLPASVTTVGGYAFQRCTALKNVTLPENLTTISTYMLDGCGALESVTLPEGLTTIESYAFAYSGLTSLTLPEGLTTIRERILNQNTGVTELVIPSTVTVMSDTWENGALEGSAITKLTFAQGCTAIPLSAARCMTALTEVVIPDTVTSINQKAFQDCTALERLTLPDRITSIGAKAFSGCTNLSRINIPALVTAIDASAFSGCANVIITCEYYSYATLFAIENNILFTPTGEFHDSDDYALDRGGSSYYADVKAINSNGYVQMTVNYAIKELWQDNVTDLVLHVLLPNNVALDEMTLRLNGSLCTEYTFTNRILEVPVTEDSGTLRFAIRLNGQTGIFSYAALYCNGSGAAKKEIISILNEEVNVLTLSAPDVTAEKTVSVSGIAPASAEITLSVDGVQQKTVTASKAGNWSATVELPDPQDYNSYRITAVSGTMEQSVQVVYHAGEASITGFDIYYDEHNVIKHYDLMDTGGTKPLVYYMPNSQFDFEVTFDHPEQIDKVYVTSTRNQQVKFLEAVWDAAKNAFVTDGYFDPGNTSYVPGTLSIQYTKKTEPVKVSQSYDFTSFETSADSTTVSQNTENKLAAKVDLGTLYDGLEGVGVNTAISIYDAATDGDLATWKGLSGDVETLFSYTVPGINNEKYILNLDLSDPYTYVMVVEDVTNSEFIKVNLDLALGASNVDTVWNLSKVCTTLSVVNKSADILMRQHEIEMDMDALRNEIWSASHLSSADRQMLLKKVNELEFDEGMFALAAAVLPQIIASAPAVGATMSAAPAIVFTCLLGAIVAAAPLFWEYRTGQIKDGLFSLNFVIDPSGYVYDSISGDRLEGVKTSAYCILNNDSEDFWDNAPAAMEYGTLWNAAEYNQANPLYTNADGKYAWDVPEGWWRVQYEKEGYETTWSDWLPVTPPQMEVNIGMIPLVIPGDIDGDKQVNVADAAELLWCVLLSDTQDLDADFNGDETTDEDDVVYLLWHILFPEKFPLKTS